MTKSEFREIAEAVFAEALPKARTADRDEAIALLFHELQDSGLDLEDDEFEEDGDAEPDEDGEG